MTTIAFACFAAAQAVWAETEADYRVRIEIVTLDRAADIVVRSLADRAENCRLEIMREEQEAFVDEILAAILSDLSIPEEHHAELSPVLDDKLDALDGGEAMFDAKMDANFEILRRDDQRLILLVRDCQLLGS